jgi:hypothetical protein
MTGMEAEMEMDNDNDMTKVAVVHDEGDNEHGTRTEGAGDRYSIVR